MISGQKCLPEAELVAGKFGNPTLVTILLTKTTEAQNGVALIYRKMRGSYFLAVVFVRRICTMYIMQE